MKKENIQNEFVVRCGKTTDSMEILEKTCKEECLPSEENQRTRDG